MSYINTDKIIKYLNRLSSNDGDSSVHSVVYEIKEWIAHNAEEDVEPVRRGEWVHKPNGIVGCSNCGCLAMSDSDFKVYVPSPYCPNCGAKMEDK